MESWLFIREDYKETWGNPLFLSPQSSSYLFHHLKLGNMMIILLEAGLSCDNLCWQTASAVSHDDCRNLTALRPLIFWEDVLPHFFGSSRWYLFLSSFCLLKILELYRTCLHTSICCIKNDGCWIMEKRFCNLKRKKKSVENPLKWILKNGWKGREEGSSSRGDKTNDV